MASPSTTGTFMPLGEGVKPLAYQESNAPQAVSKQTPLEVGCSASTPDKLSGPKESFNEMAIIHSFYRDGPVSKGTRNFEC